jgi:hypothetical protein
VFWAIPTARRGCGRAGGRTVATGDDVLRWNFLRTLAPLALAANLREWRPLSSNLLSRLTIHHLHQPHRSCGILSSPFWFGMLRPSSSTRYSGSVKDASYEPLVRAKHVACDYASSTIDESICKCTVKLRPNPLVRCHSNAVPVVPP